MGEILFVRMTHPIRVVKACIKAIELASAISAAIGEISIEEADNAIIREFTETLKNGG